LKLSYMWVDSNLPASGRITGIRENLDKTLEKLQILRYNGIEVMIGNPFNFDVKSFQKTLDKYNLQTSQLCTGEFWGTYNLCLNDPQEKNRREALRWAFKTVDIAEKLKCSVNVGRFRGKIWNNENQDSVERMFEAFISLDKYALEHGVWILLEPLKPNVCDTLNTLKDSLDVIESLGLQSTGIMLDTDHTDLVHEEQWIEKLNLFYVHLSDTDHLPLGKGRIPFERYFSILRKYRYEGYLSVETFCCELQCIEESNSLLSKHLLVEGDGNWIWRSSEN